MVWLAALANAVVWACNAGGRYAREPGGKLSRIHAACEEGTGYAALVSAIDVAPAP